MAAAAYAAALVGGWLGIFVAFYVYSKVSTEETFGRWHAAQAGAWNVAILVFFFGFILFGLHTLVGFGSGGVTALMVLIPLTLFGLLGGTVALAIQAYRGADAPGADRRQVRGPIRMRTSHGWGLVVGDTFTVEKWCGSCAEHLLLRADTDSGSQSSDRRDGGGELMWTLRVQVEQSYESLERYITEEYVNDDGSREYAHRQEAYIYERDFDSYYSVQREARDGTRDSMWAGTMTIAHEAYEPQNERYHEHGGEEGCHPHQDDHSWPHCEVDGGPVTRYDQAGFGGDQPHLAFSDPVWNRDYSWQQTWIESWDGGAQERTTEEFIQLVPNDLSQMESGDDTRSEIRLDVRLEAWLNWDRKNNVEKEACESFDDGHKHDCFTGQFQIYEMDGTVEDFAEAADKGRLVAHVLVEYLKTKSISKAARAALGLSVAGFAVSWILDFAVEGDILYLGADEYDWFRGTPFTQHRTWYSTVPSLPGWAFSAHSFTGGWHVVPRTPFCAGWDFSWDGDKHQPVVEDACQPQ